MKNKLLIMLIVILAQSLFAISFEKNVISSEKSKVLIGSNVYPDSLHKITGDNYFSLQSLNNVKSYLKESLGKNHSINFINFRDPKHNFNFRGNILGGFDYVSGKKDSSYYYVYKGFRFYGNYQKHLTFYANWWAGHISGNKDYALNNAELLNGFYKYTPSVDSNIYVDRIQGFLKYHTKIANLELGRGKFNIGENIGGSVILSNNTNDYGYFSTTFNYNNWRLSLLHCELIADSVDTNYYYKTYENKFLALHMLEWQNETNHIFAGEEIVYGNRSPEINYFLPHIFWRNLEHNLNDRDNVMIFLGGEKILFSNAKIYFNLNLDELRKSEIFSNWWGNKYAFQFGLKYFLNKKEKNSLTFQFTAVRPWVYTHKDLIDKFSNDGVGLGFTDGSNLIQYSFLFKQKIFSGRFRLFSKYTRQGSLGNDFSINYESRPKNTANWLEGKITDTFHIDSSYLFHINKHHSLKIGIKFEHSNSDLIEEFLSYSFCL